MWCWGRTGFTGPGSIHASPVQIGTRTGWVQVSAGNASACALHGDPTLWCFGSDNSGQLGNGTTSGFDPSPVRVGTSPDWLQISAGAMFDACAIQRGNTLWCWGDNTDGKVGIGTAGGTQDTPVQIG